MTSRANQSMSMSMDSANDESFTSLKSNILNSNTKKSHTSPQKALSQHWNVADARKQLRKATIILSNRGLRLAARWAAEQLNGLKIDDIDESTHVCTTELVEDDTKCSDLELYAKSIFDLGEYYRAASTLSENPIEEQDTDVTGVRRRVSTKGGDLTMHPPKNSLTSYGIYLRAYALFMAGERRKEEEVLELRDPLERTAMRNGNLSQLLREMHTFYKNGMLDAFGLHVYAMVLKEAQKSPAPKASSSPLSVIYKHGIEMPSAQRIIIQSLKSYPFNWSAWLDLVELCEIDPSIHSEVQELLDPISSHWMYHFFCVHLFLAKEANEDALVTIEQLIHGTDGYGFFVSSPYLQYQIAIAHYNMMDYETANGHFRLLIERDPQRLDQIDVYSNILYVKDDKVSLSSLAHRAMKLDKYRPETCCIVGNYYSLKGQHEKAVQYFQRALKLDRTYLSAWTLMGHEYIEMKNSAAAIEAYRRAVDINPRDYRAWYGLGQTYEIMGMLLYALFYFRKAVELRPHDPRMWCAIGGCYYGLDRRNDAIRSYERAVSKNDVEGIATRKLAMLYCEDGNAEKAARCYLRHLDLRYQAQIAQQQTPVSSDIDYYQIISSVNVDEPEAEGLLYLASYYRDHQEYDMAMLCCSRLLDFPGPEKEEGKALQREIRTVMDNRASGRTGQDDDDMDEEETFDLSD